MFYMVIFFFRTHLEHQDKIYDEEMNVVRVLYSDTILHDQAMML